MAALDGESASALFDVAGRLIAGTPGQVPDTFSRERATHVAQGSEGRRWLVDPCLAPRAHLTLFGAGHVGAAIVRALAHLPCTITWVDEREDMFPAALPAGLPANVRIAATDTPEEFVAMAPPGGSFLVMTHSHALDQRLTQAIMEREDAGWFGLIGSHTKRKQFEHRLQARGVPDERIAAMVCPIGMPGIHNKAPAVIAASVACQLLMVWEEAASAALAAPLRLVPASAPSRRKKRAAIYPL